MGSKSKQSGFSNCYKREFASSPFGSSSYQTTPAFFLVCPRFAQSVLSFENHFLHEMKLWLDRPPVDALAFCPGRQSCILQSEFVNAAQQFLFVKRILAEILVALCQQCCTKFCSLMFFTSSQMFSSNFNSKWHQVSTLSSFASQLWIVFAFEHAQLENSQPALAIVHFVEILDFGPQSLASSMFVATKVSSTKVKRLPKNSWETPKSAVCSQSM